MSIFIIKSHNNKKASFPAPYDFLVVIDFQSISAHLTPTCVKSFLLIHSQA